MSVSTLLPCIEGIAIDSIASTYHSIVLRLSTVAPYVACPLCGVPSGRVHSRYERTLADLPWNRVAVRIHLRSRKLFCDNATCERSIFTEPLPELAARYARKTLRLQEALYLIGYVLGGKAGARVALGLGLSASPDTLLRRVRQVTTENSTASKALRIVGVDDWAFKKGHCYGTILVDLERRCLVELLPDRSCESLAAWLKKHPGIEIVSRDRAQVYAVGAREGAPEAEHVADRWHLLRNLGEAMERLTAQHASHLRQAAKRMLPPPPEVPPGEETPLARLPRCEQQRLERCTEREALYNRIKQLRQQERTIQVIATETGVSKRTVLRFLRAEKFPARARRRRQPRNTDPFLPYLQQQMEQGCHNAAQLYRDVKSQGYTGSYGCIYNALQRIAPKQTGHQKARSPADWRGEVPSSTTVAWWLQGHFATSKPEVTEEQKAFLNHLYTLAPVLKEAAELAQTFVCLVKKRQRADLEDWLKKARQSACREIQLFAQGLCPDLAAVQNAVTMEWSNGQTEGQVNRLKMLKRQMYGRANFDLLRARVLPMVQAA
jgi:transposase